MLIPNSKRTLHCFVPCLLSKKGRPCACNPNPILSRIKPPKKDERDKDS